MPRRRAATGPAIVLTRAELRDVIDLALWTGALLLERGAPAALVEQTATDVGLALGCDRLDLLITPTVIMATSTEGSDFRTKLRRVGSEQTDMAGIVALTRLARRVATGRCGRQALRRRLAALDTRPPEYPWWLVAVGTGLGCGALSRLFGADWAAFGLVFVAAAVAALLRQGLARRRVAAALNVLATAFAASLLTALGTRVVPTNTPDPALAGAVLLLAPGVALVHAFEELVRGYSVMAVSRAVHGLLVSFAIAVGLLLGMRAGGVIAL